MSKPNSENFDGYGRKCLMVFAVVMVITLSMVAVFYAHPANQHMAIGITLAAAAVNAVFVAGYLMHIVSERRLTMLVLAFTTVFFVALLCLTIGARLSVPVGTVH